MSWFSFVLSAPLRLASPLSGAIPPSQWGALIRRYHELGGKEWQHGDHCLEEPGTECGWYGIFCDEAWITVTGLLLASNGLSGTLTDAFRHLPDLIWIDLDGNSILGRIREIFGSFPHPAWLQLSRNELEGPLPDLAGAHQLVYLKLSGNRFHPPSDAFRESSISPSVPTSPRGRSRRNRGP